MYKIDNTVKFRIRDTYNDTLTGWHEDVLDALYEFKRSRVGGYLASYYDSLNVIVKYIMFNEYDTGEADVGYIYNYRIHSIEKWLPITYITPLSERDTRNSERYIRVRRFLQIECNDGKIYGAHKLPEFCYNYGNIIRTWVIKKDVLERFEREQRRKIEARRASYYRYKFRCGSVEGIRCCRGGGYGRRISYKHTLLALQDDQCKEYGVKVRTRTARDAYDIEPFEDIHMSWKDYKKNKRQWMKHFRK